MWVKVSSQNTAEYVDLDKVSRIVFSVGPSPDEYRTAQLYGIGGAGLVHLGSVNDAETIQQLLRHLGLIRDVVV